MSILSRGLCTRLTAGIIGLGMCASAGAQPAALTRPADGFALTVPAGWKDATAGGATVALVRADRPGVQVTIEVHREPAPAPVTAVLARLSVRLADETARTVVSSDFAVVHDRPALVAELEDKTTRYRLTAVPRDEGETSQVYYLVTAAAPRAAYAAQKASFDAIVAALQITPMGATATTAAAPASTRAAPSAPASTYTPGTPVNRQDVFDRILAPRPPGGR